MTVKELNTLSGLRILVTDTNLKKEYRFKYSLETILTSNVLFGNILNKYKDDRKILIETFFKLYRKSDIDNEYLESIFEDYAYEML